MRRTEGGHPEGTIGEPRTSGVEPRCGGAHRSYALCIQHSVRPHRVGRGTSGLRTQDSDRPMRQFLYQPQAQRTAPVPLAGGKRIRHLRLRTRLKLNLRSTRNGSGGEEDGARRQAGGGRNRRRLDERRTGFRGTEQRFVYAEQPAHHPQRQQYEHRPQCGPHGCAPTGCSTKTAARESYGSATH